MAKKMDEFLLQYYMQLRFNRMPPEARAQFDKYLKSGDFRGNMKDWRDKYHLIEDSTGKWLDSPLPDPNAVGGEWELTPDEWEKLFNAFQNALRAMAANKKSFKDNDKATKFLDEWFGDDKLFSLFPVSSATQNNIDQLHAVLTHPALRDKMYTYLSNTFETRSEYNDFLNDLKGKKYKSDPKFRDKLIRITNLIQRDVQQGNLEKSPDIENALRSINLAGIVNGFDDDGRVAPTKLQYFRDNYASLLDNLYSDAKVYDVFKSYDSGKISKPFEEAREKVNYGDKNSDDYLPPVRDDELTPWQKFKDNVGDTWADYMDKYVKFTGDRMYFSDAAKQIVKALDGAKIKPTDGLDKVLKSSKDIADKLTFKSATAKKHFDWFVKTMSDLQATMPKAFAGALQHGEQMNALISEMIIQAAENGKVEECKTAMEILSVIKYGLTTSKIMDALGKEMKDMSILSDKGLSWNKNETVAMITKAMDNSIKFAFKGIGYGITTLGNLYNLSGGTFGGNPKRTEKRMQAHKDKTDAQKQALESEVTQIQGQQDAQHRILDDLNVIHGINDTTKDQYIDYATRLDVLHENINKFRAIKLNYPDLDRNIANLDNYIKTNPTHPHVFDWKEQLDIFKKIQQQRDDLHNANLTERKRITEIINRKQEFAQ